jgi:hypothetical protein
MKTVVILLMAAAFQCLGQTDTNLIATGDWSPIVSDSRGHSLRGRLLVYDDSGPSAANHARIYLELHHPFQGAWDAPIEINYDVGVHPNLNFEMRDGAGKAIAQTPIVIRGPAPSPVWVSLPCDATIRLRADGYLLGPPQKPDGLEVFVQLGCWVIPKNATNDYFLSAIFSPEKEEGNRSNWYHWQGTLELPKVRIKTN